jgi:hypothetical protein
MDINLTGALATNVSLMQSPKTDYLPLLTQIIATLLTIGATLGGVYLKGHLDEKAEAAKRGREEEEMYYKRKKMAYQEFLSAFSEPIDLGRLGHEIEEERTDYFRELTRGYLDIAMNAAEFGNIRLSSPINTDPISEERMYPTLLTENVRGITEERPLKTLEDFVEAILNTRILKSRSADQFRYLESIRLIGSIEFGPLMLAALIV